MAFMLALKGDIEWRKAAAATSRIAERPREGRFRFSTAGGATRIQFPSVREAVD